jgi:acetyltransferase-like isoleucine patch superfamily enzyme
MNLGAREDIRIGDGTIVRGLLRREAFGGRILIGSNVYVGDDCLLSSGAEIVIGDGCMLAHGVQIFDNHTHPIDPTARAAHRKDLFTEGHGAGVEIESAPVSIGLNAWIGFNAIILQGVKIGSGALVGAGSVVVHDVPEDAVAVGNPARVVRGMAAESSLEV